MNSTAQTVPAADSSDNERWLPGVPGQRRSPENPGPKIPPQRTGCAGAERPKLRRSGRLTRAALRDRRLVRQLDAALYTNQPGLARRIREERDANWALYDSVVL
jgi:hypothetical protein